jgi:hypothetical protein
MPYAPFPYDAFDTDLHREWTADRALRRRVPLHETWRGCLGLAMLLDRPDDTEAHGDLALVVNDRVTWLALRDVPVGRCPGSAVQNRREVNYANTARAQLKYGMPVIDFTRDARDAVDFRFMPIAAHARRRGPHPWDVERVVPQPDTLDCDGRAREFAVLNNVSAAMTAFAFGGVAADGRTVRPAWAARRPDGTQSRRPTPPARWMPRPYLSFPAGAIEAVYASATGGGGGGVPITPAFRDGFCRAMAGGVRVTAVGPETYAGPQSRPPSPTCGHADRAGAPFVGHRLVGTVDGASRVVTLPANALVTARPGDRLDGGQPWASLPPAPAFWRRLPRRAQWARLHEACGGHRFVGPLLRLWLAAQAARVATAPDAVLVPADLVSGVVRDVPPAGLSWDTGPALPYFEWETSAAVFPPLRLGRWDALRVDLPGEVDVNAGIADPRVRVGRPGVRGKRSALGIRQAGVRSARPVHFRAEEVGRRETRGSELPAKMSA